MARYALIADTENTGDFALVLSCQDSADGIRGLIFASGDGRSGYECGIVGANVVIQTVTLGGAGSVVTNASGDTPSAAPASVAHGIAAVDQNFELEVRSVSGKIEVYIDGTLLLSHTRDQTVFAGYKHLGWVAASPTGKKVTRAQICSLDPKLTEAAELLVAVCGGAIWLSDKGEIVRLAPPGTVKTQGPVSMAEFLQKVYIADGGREVIVDAQARTVTKTVPTAGSLPGATSGVVGSTRTTIVASYQDRLVRAGNKTDPQNAILSAIGDPLDLDSALGIDFPGAAFDFTASNRPKPGQPIVGIIQGARNALNFLCTRSIWELRGDPALGTNTVTVDPLTLAVGASGPESAFLGDEGVLLLHSPDGLYLIPVGGEPIPLSRHVLTEGIQFPSADIDKYIVQVRRDPARHKVFIFLTKRKADADSPALHFVYEERVGGYNPTAGGFFPIQFEDRVGPTASCLWRGRLLIGTRDGYICELKEGVKSDHTLDADGFDDIRAIECRFACTLLDSPDLTKDTLLRRLVVLTGDDSDTLTYKVYGGRSPEEAYSRDPDWLLVSGEVGAYAKPIVKPVRAPALVLELSSNAVGTAFRVEAVQVDLETKSTTRRRKYLMDEIGTLCDPPAAAVVEPDPDDGPGADDDFGAMVISPSFFFPYDHGYTHAESVGPPDNPGGGGPGPPGNGNPGNNPGIALTSF